MQKYHTNKFVQEYGSAIQRDIHMCRQENGGAGRSVLKSIAYSQNGIYQAAWREEESGNGEEVFRQSAVGGG